MKKVRKIIGVCGSYLFNQQPIQFLKALHDEGIKYEYCLTALSCGTDSEEDNDDTKADYELVSLIRYLPLSGMIILAATIRNTSVLTHIMDVCAEKNIPVFSIDVALPGCYNMTMDNAQGFEHIVRHVIEAHGCKRINMLAGFKGNSFSEERIDAYRKVLTEYNIPVEEERIGYGDFWERPARQAVRSFLNSSLPSPDAIVCANDAMAIAAYAELQESGYQVPEDIILTGFDGILSGQYHFPSITTCEPDFEEASAFIIQELEAFHAKGCFSPCSHKITMLPSFKQSCGCMTKTVHNMSHVISTLFENSGDSAWHNITMNRLITDNLYHDHINELIELLPRHLHMWKNHFRFACVKASMLSSFDIPNTFSDLVSLMDIRSNEFVPAGRSFPIEAFIPDIDNIEDTDILIVRLLNSGKDVYGYSVEGFHDIDERSMQRCNDFAFFLSYCLNTIIHNGRQKELADGLLKANHEISMISLQDSMTGLYNRRGFYHVIEQVMTEPENMEKYLSVFSIDMNCLKYINDTFGHAEGDFAITTLANAICQAAGEKAICSRFGGDEFTVALLSDSDNSRSADTFHRQIAAYIAVTEGVVQKPYRIAASIGMCCQKITSSINIESMIAAADRNMYHMKQQNKTNA